MHSDKLDRLRALAEQAMQEDSLLDKQPYLKESQSLIHQLRVHQIELEMQNEQLLQTTEDLENTRDQYQELYDFAPVGYATLNHKGSIKQANLMLVKMLGVDRRQLQSTTLSCFVASDDADIFYRNWNTLLAENKLQAFDVRLQRSDGKVFYSHLEIINPDSIESPGHYFAVITDINQQKKAELKKN